MADVWPFRPVPNSIEGFSFYTDVMRGGTGERRVASREARKVLAFSYTTRERMAGRMADALRTGRLLDWLVPSWAEATQVPTILSPTMIIAVEPADWALVSQVLIWGGVDNWTLRTIEEYNGTEIVLTATVGKVYQNALVMPVYTGYLTSGLEVVKLTDGKQPGVDYNNANNLSVTFGIRTEEFPEPVAPALQFEGVPVVTQCGVPVPLNGGVDADVVYIDNTSGPVVLSPTNDLLAVRYGTLWRGATPEVRQAQREFIRWANGRDQSFYLAGWGRNLRLTTDAPVNAAYLFVRPLFPTLSRYVGQVVCMQDGNGPPLFSRITAAAQIGDAHRLTLQTPPGRGFATRAKVSFMRRVRLDSDTIEVTQVHGFYSELSLPLIEVPTT